MLKQVTGICALTIGMLMLTAALACQRQPKISRDDVIRQVESQIPARASKLQVARFLSSHHITVEHSPVGQLDANLPVHSSLPREKQALVKSYVKASIPVSIEFFESTGFVTRHSIGLLFYFDHQDQLVHYLAWDAIGSILHF